MENKLYGLLKNKKYFIFDFDGTITNNEPLQYLAHVRNCKQYGFDLNKEDFRHLIIHNQMQVIHQNMCKRFNYPFDFAKFASDLPKFYNELVEQQDMPLNEYFLDILDNFPDKHYIMLSNEKEKFLDYHLSKWGIRDKFEQLISSFDTSKVDILNNISKYLPAKINDMVIFEDANKYLLTAKRLGMTTIGIEHEFNEGDLVADYIIKTN